VIEGKKISLERRRSRVRGRSSLLAELKSLGERSGSVIGGAYALAASAVLNRLERLEDLNAERRFRQRSKATRTAGVSKPGLPSPLGTSSQPTR